MLNNLRYADDIVRVAKDTEKLRTMAEELVEEGGKAGLKINANKTKIIGKGNKENVNIQR